MKVSWFVLLILALAGQDAIAFEWQLKRFDGRDYVSLKQIEEFYDLPSDVAPKENRLYLARGRRSLAITRDRRDLEVNGINQWLSFPVVEHDGDYWISRMDLGKTIEPAFHPEYVAGIKPFTSVVLDPGHGGFDKGAASIYENEKNFSLDVARRVRDELKKNGVQVFMTRNDDTFVELQNRLPSQIRRRIASLSVCISMPARGAMPPRGSRFTASLLAARLPRNMMTFTFAT